jgi:polysaccharide export outer membrane protein
MIRRTFTQVGLACLLLMAAGCATKSTLKVGEEIVVGQVTFAVDSEQENYRLFPEYKISAGDVLDVLYQVRSWIRAEVFKIAVDHVLAVRFFKHPELSETQHVRPDGRISLPLVGSVEVVGLTVEELTIELKKLYSKHLTEPELHIVVKEFRGAIKELKSDLKTAPRGLSRLVTVRPDGFATFAMIGDIKVAGRAVPDVAKELNIKYEAILPGLSVDLFLEKHYGSRIYVFGEVHQPGSFQILHPTSIFEALAMAGSILPSARLDSAIVFRQKVDQVVATRIDLTQLLLPMKTKIKHSKAEESKMNPSLIPARASDGSTDAPAATQTDSDYTMKSTQKMFYLHPDDIVFIPRRRLTKMAQVAEELSSILFFRGWGINMGYDWNNDL